MSCARSKSAITGSPRELGIAVGDVEKHLQELRQIAAGVALVGEVSDRTRARVMATGELMATELGARFLRTQGLDVAWADARTMLRAEERRSATAKASILSATCNFAPDEALEERLGDTGADRHHARLHSERRRWQYRAARSRRL